MYKEGLRVVRGKDWKLGNEDSGEGHLGTVVQLGSKQSKTVAVCWENGSICDHRVGHEDAYDLRVFDNAPVGVRHPGVSCDGCNEGIMGFRFKCIVCEAFDFCTFCYMNVTSHDPTHAFERFDTGEDRKAQRLLLRSQSRKVTARGVFKDAIVVRGKDWNHGYEKGEETVENICTTNNIDGVALGLKGKVELNLIKCSSSGSYFPDHLPRLEHRTVDSPQTPDHADAVTVLLPYYLTDKSARDNAHVEFASVMYKDQMEKTLANPRYIPAGELQDHHEVAIQECLQALSKVKHLTEKQIGKFKDPLKPIYEEYKESNARKETSNAPAIGLDLGTTYCCIAVYGNDGDVEIIPNSFGENTTPSYVQLDEDEIFIGNVIRMFGRNFNDPTIQKLRKYWSFGIDKGEDGKIQIKVQKQTLLPEQVLLHLLTYLKGTADAFLGDAIISAVVTVPAYFGPGLRALTKDACNKAGLNVLQFISEPAAAAVAYRR